MKHRGDIIDRRPLVSQSRFQEHHVRLLGAIDEAKAQLPPRQFSSLMDIVARRAAAELGQAEGEEPLDT